jgi:starch-binding outer membrane protein, SusD/RagB family
MNMNRIIRATSALPLLAVVALGGCNNIDDRLLSVQTPDIVTSTTANSPAGAQSFYVAAVGDFSRLIGGDRGGSSPLGLALTGGLLGDEIFSARAGTETTDDRTLNANNFPLDTWTQVGNTWTREVRALDLLTQFPPATGAASQLATLHEQMGYTLMLVAEQYCNGVPLWDGKDPNNPTTVTMSSAALYTAALAEFDSALTIIGTGDATIRNIALVGKARTLVDQAPASGLAAGLAAAAAITPVVPTNFVFNGTFSTSTSGVVNALYDWMSATKNFGASDKEGGNGLDYVSSKDPRVKIDGTKLVRGQDGSNVPTFNQYITTSAPIAIATGIEARLIEAESQLAAGNPTGWVATLNALRSSAQSYGTVTLAANALAQLTDPATPDGRVNLMFRERAFWMYLSAHRLGDMRRLVRQYGRGTETIYPTGAYFKGGVFGTDAVLVPLQTETNNTNWTACTDKNP